MNKHYNSKPLSKSTINNILANNPSNLVSTDTSEQKEVFTEEKVKAVSNDQIKILSQNIEFDSLHPEDNIKQFLMFARNVISRYEGNQQRQSELELEQQDVEHVMELSNNQDIVGGYRLYRKLADIRRERRMYKNESDLLKPLYDYLKQNSIMNDLSRLQGSCRVSKETISKRQYTLRTNIL